MSLSGLVPALLLSACCCWMLALAAEEKALPSAGPGAAAAKAPGNSSSPAVNSTSDSGVKKMFEEKLNVETSMIQRALYVLIGITLAGLLYFLIRAVRLKKPAPKKKYGLLSDYDDSVEMEGVESEEDDTLYEARSLRR